MKFPPSWQAAIYLETRLSSNVDLRHVCYNDGGHAGCHGYLQ